MSTFALSTSWNAWQHSRARELINEIKGLGFDRIELSFALTATIVKEIFDLKRRGEISVVSLHNFCPIPRGISRALASPDMFSLSSLNEVERRRAVKYTQKTIDLACRLQAAAVVIHAGRVEIEERIKQLAGFYQGRDRKGLKRLRLAMQAQRQANAERFFGQVLKSLDQLCNYAWKRKIKLAVENRYYFNEIPSFEEMEIILSKFPGPPLYYWHDVGHAQVYENLGFVSHRTILEKFSQRMAGIHLHDIEGIDDHRAPLKGCFDFTMLKPYITGAILKVLEPHYPATAEEITRGKEYLERLFTQKGVQP